MQNLHHICWLYLIQIPAQRPVSGSGQQAIAILRSQAVRSEEQRLVRRPAIHVRQLLPSPRHDIGQQPRKATGQVVVTRGHQTCFGRFFSVHFTSSFCIAHLISMQTYLDISLAYSHSIYKQVMPPHRHHTIPIPMQTYWGATNCELWLACMSTNFSICNYLINIFFFFFSKPFNFSLINLYSNFDTILFIYDSLNIIPYSIIEIFHVYDYEHQHLDQCERLHGRPVLTTRAARVHAQ